MRLGGRQAGVQRPSGDRRADDGGEPGGQGRRARSGGNDFAGKVDEFTAFTPRAGCDGDDSTGPQELPAAGEDAGESVDQLVISGAREIRLGLVPQTACSGPDGMIEG
jgi:hypothetical protein